MHGPYEKNRCLRQRHVRSLHFTPIGPLPHNHVQLDSSCLAQLQPRCCCMRCYSVHACAASVPFKPQKQHQGSAVYSRTHVYAQLGTAAASNKVNKSAQKRRRARHRLGRTKAAVGFSRTTVGTVDDIHTKASVQY